MASKLNRASVSEAGHLIQINLSNVTKNITYSPEMANVL